MAAELIQIYYKDDQKSKIYQCAKPYFNHKLTIFFENSVIKDLVLATESEKIGVCSWKLSEKMRWYIGRPRPITEDVINSDYEVLSFTRNSKYHEMLNAAEIWHKGFKQTLRIIMEKLGINCPHEVKIPIYQNHFMAKTSIYRDYVNNYLSPAMDLMTNDPEVNKMVMIDSNYTALAKKDAADSKYLQEKIGVPYYPLAPFILERLFSVYVHNKNIPVTWL